MASAPVEAADLKKVDYPTRGRAITIIVPFAPGGANDIAARLQAPALEKELGVSVVVVNKPGASTQVGMTQLVQAKPDGHTLGLLTLPGAMQAYLDPSRKAIYSRKDFTVVALQSWDPNGLAVKADSPYKNLKDLVAAARVNPEKVKIGTSGLLSTDHMVLLLLQKVAAVKVATDDADVRKRMNEMALTVRYMDEKQAGVFWDELEAQTKPLLSLAK
jgi:tripartite-type tricarboxylate transporter receptor subunit TctC